MEICDGGGLLPERIRLGIVENAKGWLETVWSYTTVTRLESIQIAYSMFSIYRNALKWQV